METSKFDYLLVFFCYVSLNLKKLDFVWNRANIFKMEQKMCGENNLHICAKILQSIFEKAVKSMNFKLKIF